MFSARATEESEFSLEWERDREREGVREGRKGRKDKGRGKRRRSRRRRGRERGRKRRGGGGEEKEEGRRRRKEEEEEEKKGKLKLKELHRQHQAVKSRNGIYHVSSWRKGNASKIFQKSNGKDSFLEIRVPTNTQKAFVCVP